MFLVYVFWCVIAIAILKYYFNEYFSFSALVRNVIKIVLALIG